MPGRIALLAFINTMFILSLYSQDIYKKEVIFSLDVNPVSFPLGNYAFNLHDDATQNAGAFRGWGGSFSIYYTPVKLLIFGGEIGLFGNSSNITNLDYNLASFVQHASTRLQANTDTFYLPYSKQWYQVPILGKVGINVAKRKFDFTLMSGLGTMVSITPQIKLNEYVPVNMEYYKYLGEAALFSQKAYVLFAYSLSCSFNYRFIPMMSIGVSSELLGTQKKYQPYVLSPSYGYDNYILYTNLGLDIRLYFQQIKSSSLSKSKG